MRNYKTKSKLFTFCAQSHELLVVSLLLSMMFFTMCHFSAVQLYASERPTQYGKIEQRFERIVSLAPSLTETLFALGLGDKVVGVTDFCTFPPEVKTKTKIGGFIDPNIEIIVGLKPDLVVLLPDHKDIKTRLENLGIRCLAVPQFTVKDIIEGLKTVGEACGAVDKAAILAQKIENDITKIRRAVENLPKPRVILAVGRELTGNRLDQACLVGSKGYLNELLEYAGGINAVGSSTLTYPTVSREGLAALAPEVVIDLIPDPGRQITGTESIQLAWSQVPGLPAARCGRIYVLESDFAAIPGPRVAEVVREFARLLHPNARW